MIDSPPGSAPIIGAAIRAVRFSRGLTQSDGGQHETGRRRIPAETLIDIARLCGKPLGFFEPAEQSQIAELAETYPARNTLLAGRCASRTTAPMPCCTAKSSDTRLPAIAVSRWASET